MSKEKYQEALELIINRANRLKLTFVNNVKIDEEEQTISEVRNTLQQLIDIYPEYLELKSRATPKKPTYSQNDMEFQCKCVNELKGYENFCPDCGQAMEWNK